MKAFSNLLVILLLIGMGSCSKEGPVGPTGEQGAQGEQGIKGSDGTMLRYGQGAPGNSVGQQGDFYIDIDKNMLYGPLGSGGWGSGISMIGAKGDTGAKGQDGNQFHNGTAVPTTQGKVGDFYFHTVTTTLYGPKSASGWGTGISLKGPKGDPGNANVKKYSFTVKKDDWFAAGDFRFGNYHDYFWILGEANMYITNPDYTAIAYVRPHFSGQGMLKKQIPYVFGVNNNYGLKFELHTTPTPVAHLLMSKTTNGWNNAAVPMAERPDELDVEIILIEVTVVNMLQGKLDFTDIDAVTTYFNLD